MQLTKTAVPKIKERIKQNLFTTQCNLEWNIKNEVQLYRLTSNLVPLSTHPEFIEWQNKVGWVWYEDKDILQGFDNIREIITEGKQRVSIHPGQYTVLNSPNPIVRDKSIEDLWVQYTMIRYIGGTGVVIHIGGGYGNKEESKNRFIQVVNQLPKELKDKLWVENDDKTYNLKDALQVAKATNTKPLFDYHHNKHNPSDNLMESLRELVGIWGGEPKVHLSSGNTRSHEDYIKYEDYQSLLNLMQEVGGVKQLDIMLECKEKNRALQKLKEESRNEPYRRKDRI